MTATDRLTKLAEWIERDRWEPDKVLAYARDLATTIPAALNQQRDETIEEVVETVREQAACYNAEPFKHIGDAHRDVASFIEAWDKVTRRDAP